MCFLHFNRFEWVTANRKGQWDYVTFAVKGGSFSEKMRKKRVSPE